MFPGTETANGEGDGRVRPRKYVIIPVEILDNPNLSPTEVYLLTQILRRQSEIDTITVAYLKTVLKLSENTIRYGLLKLTECGYLTRGAVKGSWVINFAGIDPVKPQNLSISTSNSEPQNLNICVEEKEEERSKEEDKEYIYNTALSDSLKDQENEKEKDKKEKDEPKKPKRASKPFVKPTLEEVQAYCKERHSTVSAQHFFDWYESNGWMVGRNHMKDFKAAVRTWEQKDRMKGITYIPPENREDEESFGDCPF